MKIHLYSPVAFEPWDWRNSVEKGIGGSETSHVEMAWRLARRGHEVTTYAPIPDDCPGTWRGTTWRKLADADFSAPGLWVLYRCPSVVDEFLLRSPRTHVVWLLFQDWTYPDLTPQRIARCARLVTLCHAHGRDLRRTYPTGADRIWITSNGLKRDLLEQVEADGVPERDPHKILWASSPDRGLLHVLRSVERAREYVPTLTLHAFYGYDNLNKLIAQAQTPSGWHSHDGPPRHPMAADKAAVERYASQPWFHLRGRVDQPTLYREWLSSGLWVYQTNFNETSCITCMEVQACGAIPIVHPVYALAENVRHGIGIDGDAYGDPLTKARFAMEIVRASDPAFQDAIRPTMMADARARFDWEQFVDQWEVAAADDLRGAPAMKAVLRLPAVSNEVTDALRHGRDWELELTPLFAEAAGGVAIDVGAYVGEHALRMAAVAREVWAYEPQPAVAAYLRANAEAYRNVLVSERPVYDRAVAMDIVDENDWRSGTSPGACYVPVAGDGVVVATTLDADWETAGRPTVTLLKIDAEGCDAAALRGAEALLAACRPVVLCERGNAEQTARHGDQPDSAQRMLERRGYTIDVLSETNLVAWPSPRPLLSVVTPSLRPDGLHVVRRCLMRQTYLRWEWIVAVPARHVAAVQAWAAKWHPKIRVIAEPHDATHFYQLNKAWNALFAEARGEAIVSATDWLWFEDDALRKLAQAFIGDPTTCVSVPTNHVPQGLALGDVTDDEIDRYYARAVPTWVDYRLLQGRSCGDRVALDPTAVELNFALLPKRALDLVGGMDERYDAVAGMSEKHLAYRLRATGVDFVLDKRVKARAVEHDKEWANWDAKFAEAKRMLDADVSIMATAQPRLLEPA